MQYHLVLYSKGKKSMYEWIELMTKERLVLTSLRPGLASRSLSPPGRSGHSSPLSHHHSGGCHQNQSRSLQNSPLPHHDSPRPEARARPVSGSVYSTLYRPRNSLSVTSPPRLRADIRGEQNITNRGPHTTLRPRDQARETRRHSSYFVTQADNKVDTGTTIEGQIKS